ncbi:MAG TPA: hypothetical protein VGH28_28675 [Polyangiaceae bacterium]|jgi:hypothetical protein
MVLLKPRWASLFVLVAPLAGCSLLFDFDGYAGDAGDAGEADGPAIDATSEPSPVDASSESIADAGPDVHFCATQSPPPNANFFSAPTTTSPTARRRRRST